MRLGESRDVGSVHRRRIRRGGGGGGGQRANDRFHVMLLQKCRVARLLMVAMGTEIGRNGQSLLLEVLLLLLLQGLIRV